MPIDTTQKPGLNPMKLAIVISILFLFLLTAGASVLSAQSYAQDKITLQNVVLIQKFLDQYKLDNNTYPTSVNGQPTGFAIYLEKLPMLPSSCLGHQNIYEQLSSGNNYKLNFCLSHAVSGFSADANFVQPK